MPVPAASALPAELTSIPHWVAWRTESREGSTRSTKVPYCLATGYKASSTKPADWSEYPEAAEVPEAYDGIGFVFTKQAGFTGVDLDDCLNIDGTLKTWAIEILDSLPSYSEISPSGSGIKIWAKALLSGNGLKVYIDSEGNRTVESMADGAIEMYDSGRYFAVTGNNYAGTITIADLQPEITALYQRLRGNERPELLLLEPTTGKFEIPAGPAVAEGGRHEFLLSTAAKWRARGADITELTTKLRELNQLRCSPPKPDHMLIGIAKWFEDKPPSYRPTRADYASAAQWAVGPEQTVHAPIQPPMLATPMLATGVAVPSMASPSMASAASHSAAVAVQEAIPPAPDPSSPLAFRVGQAIARGVESCYEPDLARLFALAYLGGAQATIEADALEDKLKKEFKADLNLQRLRKAIRAIRDEISASVAGFTGSGWESGLIRKPPSFQNAAPCVTNALLYFENHPDWSGNLRWNEFTSEPVVVGDLPIGLNTGDPVRDHHDTLMQSWFERETQDYKWSIDTVRRSADAWAKAHSFNPVKDYLNGLPEWDGVPRLSSWLFKYCGAGPIGESDPDSSEGLDLSDFISAIGERWWISAIARIFEPGCKVHHVLVLEGAKGIGKTTLTEIIFGEWYAVILGDVTSKDNQALMSAGVWGVLMDELDVLGKSEMRSIKSWVTRDFEKFRPTWGHRHEKRLRQCVFIATVNGSDWALEEDRRWWPVACHRAFDLDGLRHDRDLLMAEALHRYRSRQRWYFHAEEDAGLIATAKKEQSARVPEDTWQGLVSKALNKAKEVSPVQSIGARRGVFISKEEVIDMLPQQQQNNRDVAANRVGRAMKSMPGWQRVQITAVDGARPWKYYLPWD